MDLTNDSNDDRLIIPGPIESLIHYGDFIEIIVRGEVLHLFPGDTISITQTINVVE